MNTSKKNIELNNGWILCPSKSFPGKFYYFNVLNGEAAWSLNQADSKEQQKDDNPYIHKIADKSHDYPEPTSLPDDSSFMYQTIPSQIQKPNISSVQELPAFGQSLFPKYVANIDPLMSNIVWTSVPIPMFCQNKKPMYDKDTQISEFERDLFMQSSDVPLCKRFKNYDEPSLSFDSRNKIIKMPTPKFETSTPKKSFLECLSESKNCFPKVKPLTKQSILKFESLSGTKPELIKCNKKTVLGLGNKVESVTVMDGSKKIDNKKVLELENLDRTDLRYLLLAKRKSLDGSEAVEKKKPKTTEVKPVPVKKKVTFILDNDDLDDNDFNLSEVTSNEFIPDDYPHTTRDSVSNTSHKTKHSTKLVTDIPTRNKTWYIVVDTDVLLLDYEFIDKLVLSDSKCKLVIPHAVSTDIAALCAGDCRGQQRVIRARQLTRRLANLPQHYIVEPPSREDDSIVVTTDSIINCCMKAVNKNRYVVLITNDPHLQARAEILSIPAHKLNDIKYGASILPEFTSRDINTSTHHDIDKKNLFGQNFNSFSSFLNNKSEFNSNSDMEKNMFNENNYSLNNDGKIKPEISSEFKHLKINRSNEDSERKNELNVDKTNSSLFGNYSSMDKIKSLSLSSDDTDSILDDKLINITKPKTIKIVDSDSPTSDKSSVIKNLQLKNENPSKSRNLHRNPFLPKTIENDSYVNFEKRILNSNAVMNAYNFGKTILNSNQDGVFEKSFTNSNYESSEEIFESRGIYNKPFSNLKQCQNLEKSIKQENTFISLQHGTRENKTLSASQTRIKKIISTINNDIPTNQVTQSKDSTGILKIPQPLSFQNKTRNTSVHLESSRVSDKNRASIEYSIEVELKRFYVKNKTMRDKISARIDEWICTFMQILEDVLVDLLVKNSVCMKNTAAPLSLREILNCVKMLYGSHTKVMGLVSGLSELMGKCMVCQQGKFKINAGPDDFMTMFGYGMLLVLTLKNILPLYEELKDAESNLIILQNNIESKIRESDPEIVKSPSVNRSDDEVKDELVRPQFLKKKSHVLDYLKKHYKNWASYKGDLDDHNVIVNNNPEVKVLRTVGKNLNLLKIDSNRVLSLSKNTIECDTANKSNDGPKLLRLMENNQLIAEDNFGNAKNKSGFESISPNTAEKENDAPKMINTNENIDQNKDAKATEEFDFPNHGNTFLNNTDTDGPKIIRNIKLIDEFEEKIKNRESLDLDLLDYSEIFEPSAAGNVDFDVFSDKKSDVKDAVENNNNSLNFDNTLSFLEDFCVSSSVSTESKINTKSENNGSKINSISQKHSFKKAINNSQNESETYTENPDSNNSCDPNSGTQNPENNNYDSGTQLDNSGSQNLDKTVTIIRDDSTNDSGFENDSTYAHSVVKLFLNELSTSFKAIYKFVIEFVDEIREKKIADVRKSYLYKQAKSCSDEMNAITQRMRSIIKRESSADTVLKSLLRKAGVEATTDTRMMRYRQIVIKCLEQAQILEIALKIIISTTIGDFEVLTNTENIDSSIRYFNIFE